MSGDRYHDAHAPRPPHPVDVTLDHFGEAKRIAARGSAPAASIGLEQLLQGVRAVVQEVPNPELSASLIAGVMATTLGDVEVEILVGKLLRMLPAGGGAPGRAFRAAGGPS